MTSYSNNNNFKNQFRIIAGKWRGRKLHFPGEVKSLRPTTDRIRETLFNWLQAKIAGAHCLDLFTGSGALAFEACSRGAGSVTVLDRSPLVTQCVSDNATLVECSTMEIVTGDAVQWLQGHAGKRQFDIVFLDPPFSDGLLATCCDLLEAGHFLAPDAVVYLESNTPLSDIMLPANWHQIKNKKAGQVYFGVYERSIP